MDTNQAAPAMPPKGPAPRWPDLDDLIFQGEGWLVSDR